MDAVVKRAALGVALRDAMTEATQAPMVWGKDDCALWCANILQAALGYDAAAIFRGRYRTRRGAARVLGKGGLGFALKAAAREHGWQPITAQGEMIGDIGVAEINGVQSTVICRAYGWFVGRNETGFTAIPTSAVRVIWSVGS